MPQQRMRILIQQGLFRLNLLELIAISEQLLPNSPAIYGSLINLFRLLELEYEPHDAVDTVRFNSVNSLLLNPLIALLDAEQGTSARGVIIALDKVMLAFEALSH
jgi:hypothetical protein